MNSTIPDLTVALPAYEEAENLTHLLPRLHQVLREITPNYEILVVDSQAPRDHTAEVCLRHQATHLARTGGSTYGDAIRTIVRHAQGRYIVIMDADGSHDPALIKELWTHKEPFKLVIASRYIKGGQTENPPSLILMSLMVNIAFRFVLNLKCYDVSNSFRLYHGDDFRKLDLTFDNFDIVQEILIKLNPKKTPLSIKEVPCIFSKRKAGKTKRNLMAFALGYLVTLTKLYRIKKNFEQVSKGSE